mmetsp:Transcript_35785/g.112335  ORF Transcript_35785/g.112335 Transcript_35785/m.112335 type:complete len:215 (+) Transcript_35785:163-807(+)
MMEVSNVGCALVGAGAGGARPRERARACWPGRCVAVRDGRAPPQRAQGSRAPGQQHAAHTPQQQIHHHVFGSGRAGGDGASGLRLRDLPRAGHERGGPCGLRGAGRGDRAAEGGRHVWPGLLHPVHVRGDRVANVQVTPTLTSYPQHNTHLSPRSPRSKPLSRTHSLKGGTKTGTCWTSRTVVSSTAARGRPSPGCPRCSRRLCGSASSLSTIR